MSDENWTIRARRGEYTARSAAHSSSPMAWAVQGLLPATGGSVLFGTGSTGKTQLLLWLAAHIAARGEKRPKSWLGAELGPTGKLLVLSAEDLREHLFQRIGDIAWRMGEEFGWTDDQVEDVCDRIHVMPFLSMGMTEFTDLNPSLFERLPDREWGPTKCLDNIEQFLDEANAAADADGRPEDRFVGVVLDSAVSMAGFEMSQSEATTNFLFHINRMSRRQNMFWAIIGHTPKDAGKKLDDPAVERLRGSAMWSTTPRAVIELRCAGAGDNVEQVLVRYPQLEMRDVLFLSTVKANSVGADLRPRALAREKESGTFIDISEQFPALFQRLPKTLGDKDRTDRKFPIDQDRSWLAIIDLIGGLTDGGRHGETFTRQQVRDEFDRQQSMNEALHGVGSEHDGKHSRTDFSLAWYIAQLKGFGAISNGKTGTFSIIDLPSARRRFDSADTTEIPTKIVVDSHSVEVSDVAVDDEGNGVSLTRPPADAVPSEV